MSIYLGKPLRYTQLNSISQTNIISLIFVGFYPIFPE